MYVKYPLIVLTMLYMQTVDQSLCADHTTKFDEDNGKNVVAFEKESREEKVINCLPPKCWKPGDWWIVRTNFMAQLPDEKYFIGGNRVIPKSVSTHTSIVSYFRLFRAVRTEEVLGKTCWLVEIRPFDGPEGIKEEQAKDDLWRLYLSAEDLTIRKLTIDIKRGSDIYGPDEQHPMEFLKSKAVVVGGGFPQSLPFDFPKLPFQEFPTYLPKEQKEVACTDEHTPEKYVQYSMLAEEQGKPVLYVKFWNKEKAEVRAQKWVAGLPWWQEFQLVEVRPYFLNDMMDAQLVGWGNANQVPSLGN